MKRTLLFLMIWILLLVNTGHAQHKITLAYVDFPPYEYMENDQPAGMLVKIVKINEELNKMRQHGEIDNIINHFFEKIE